MASTSPLSIVMLSVGHLCSIIYTIFRRLETPNVPAQLDFLISRNRQANRHAAHIVAVARGNVQDENTDVVGWALIVQFDRIGE